MPELPEVETVKRGLEKAMKGAALKKVTVRRPDLRWPLRSDLSAQLTNTRVLGLRRRSKYILCDLSSENVLMIHLGMSGRVVIESADKTQETHHIKAVNFVQNIDRLPQHDHVVFELSNRFHIIYNDPRRFGMIDLFHQDEEAEHPVLKALGPEPLGNNLNETYLSEQLAKRNTPLKSFLLDQRIIAGLGNIYACEILWRAGLSPKRQAKNTPKAKKIALLHAIRSVLKDAIAAGGSTLNDYRQSDGTLGYFQHQLAVYGREDKTCQRSDCASRIKRIVQSGRSTYYCPTCQR